MQLAEKIKLAIEEHPDIVAALKATAGKVLHARNSILLQK